MISKNTIKLIKSLANKKFRLHEKLFLVEGDKNVAEVLKSKFKVEQLYATFDFLHINISAVANAKLVVEVTKDEINRTSLLKQPQNSLALCALPDNLFLPDTISQLALFLDDIQDPGNLGTIIRVCDWFGINQLFCSPNTVDMFNPKVIQATMGSFCRVQTQKISFNELAHLVKKSKVQVFGSFMDGNNIYNEALPHKALIVVGNEGNGVGTELEPLIERKIGIPRFTNGAESLNVAIATAIICSEFRRKM